MRSRARELPADRGAGARGGRRNRSTRSERLTSQGGYLHSARSGHTHSHGSEVGWIAVLSLVASRTLSPCQAPPELSPVTSTRASGLAARWSPISAGSSAGSHCLCNQTGKLVAGGMNEDDFLLVRILADESPDPVFDQDGIVTTDFYRGPMHNDIVSGLCFPAGAARRSRHGRRGAAALPPARARSRLPAIGSTGASTRPSTETARPFTTSVGSQPVPGTSLSSPTARSWSPAGLNAGTPDFDAYFALARFNVDGSLDPTFGDAGQVITELGSNGDWAFAVALQGDGRIVAVVGTGDNPAYFAIARYNTDGTLDQKVFLTGTVNKSSTSAARRSPSTWRFSAYGYILVAGAAGPGADVEFDFGLACALTWTEVSIRKASTRAWMLRSARVERSSRTSRAATTEPRRSPLSQEGRFWWRGLDSAAHPGQGSDFGLARYHVNGSLDQDFGAVGRSPPASRRHKTA